MASVRCRKCGKAVSNNADSCPACGCRPPFACSVCSKAMSAFALNFKKSKKYPFGGYSPEGEPVCYDHRRVRCYTCGELFEQHEMKRRVVGMREDRVLRHGMRPRVEEFFGSFCPGCDRDRKRGRSAKSREEEVGPTGSSYALFVCGLLVVGLVAVFWFLISLLK